MPLLSWNEIKTRSIAFAKEWENESSEDAEAKSFWDDFFNVFGLSRRRVATFEEPVKKLDKKQGFIDLLWKGVILVEHKSRGKDLDKAYQQAKDYFPGLKEHELPKYILVSDFQKFRLYDLDEGIQHDFPLSELSAHAHLFGFIAGYQKRVYKDEDPVNIEAAERMGRLHDRLEESGYTGHALEVYLVRILFCLFAEDTGIFERTQFQEFVDSTKEDGSDLAMQLAQLFQTLNTDKPKRLKTLDETLGAFPYVNGKLFEEMLPFAAFDSKMREMLLYACGLDWSRISPAIFGSMFQAVMNPKERRNLGAHYTSEKNIMKVIKPLFLDDLYNEFEKAKGNRNKLNELHKKIASLHFLDPACGCGNFLIISYRELRVLELQILRELNKSGQLVLDVRELIQVDVDQFAGIEYDEFPARIAEVAMWLMDHQMNIRVSDEFGQYFVRLPLNKSAKILNGNALRVDWGDVISNERQNYILGNPPFIGHQWRSNEQMEDMNFIWRDSARSGRLDYVTCWFKKAAEIIHESPEIKAAFVTTNSITQGEQPAILWSELNRLKMKIHFAHRTFKWENEAKGKAAVHVVIIGFGLQEPTKRILYIYPDISSEPHSTFAKNINAYLVDGQDVILQSRGKNLCGYPEMFKGSQPTDGGYLILSEEERLELIHKEPAAIPFIRPFMGAEEFINSKKRYCLWLKNVSPADLKKMPIVLQRIENVRESRMKSPTPSVREYAKYPSLFTQDRQPNTEYLAVPEVSSENRKYIPLGFLSPNIVCSNKLQIIPNATFFMFGVMQSEMHMVWVKYTCGRMKSDFSYSPAVYNNFPFPLNPTDAQKMKVDDAAINVLSTRAKFEGSSLADLYNLVTMPPDLVKAHQALDKAVDLCYRSQPFANELSRIEFLFGLYEQYTAPMFKDEGKKKGKKG